jgi:type I restriction enzyme S subunit
MKWEKVRLGDVIYFNPTHRLLKDVEYDSIAMEHISIGTKYVYPAKLKTSKSSGSKFQNGDTLFARITPCLENGKIAEVKGLKTGIGIGSTEFFVFRNIEGITSQKYIYYLAFTEQIKETAIKSMQGASGRQRALREPIVNLQISLPPLPIQNTIAAILSAYDDLIENNLRRIKLLEDAAKCEYKLLISGCSKHIELWKFTEPIKRGISPKYVSQDGVVVVNQKCVRGLNIDFSLSKLTDKQKNIPSERMLRRYDVVVNSTGTGTLGRISINLSTGFDCTVDSHVTIVRARDTEMSTFLAMSLLAQSNVISLMGVGSTNQTELSPKRLGQEILIPQVGIELISLFHKSVSSKFDLIWNLSQQNIQLRQAKDILLPKLMSGQIDVSKRQQATKLIPLQTPVISMVAEDAVMYETKKPKAGAKYYLRTLLAAYIVDNLWQQPTFGHVKLMKLMYLCEHIAHIETVSNYHRDAAGPYDNQMIRSIDKQLNEKGWFEMYKKEGKFPKYKPLPNSKGYTTDFNKYYTGKLVGIDKLIARFGTADTEQVEMVATVYEAWRSLKSKFDTVSIDTILNEVLNKWHESKKRITKERWTTCYNWVLEQGWMN